MRGLPASGKSTKAKEIVDQSGNYIRLNKDLLRKMLHFNIWSGRRERQTFHAEQILAKSFLGQGKNVIIDDTNLNPGVFSIWKDLHSNREVIDVNTPYDECVERDAHRPDSVGMPTIFKMARKYDRYPWGEAREVICDIDGTVADIDHRLHFVKGEKKRWGDFFDAMWEDTVRQDTLDMILRYKEAGRRIIFVSGRPEKYSIITENWLRRWNIPYDGLIMRPDKDSRPDYEIKRDILRTYFQIPRIDVVFDDRPSVIRMWRSLGLEVIDMGKGKEF